MSAGSYPPGPDFEIPPKNPKPSFSEVMTTIAMVEIPVWVCAACVLLTAIICTTTGYALGARKPATPMYGASRPSDSSTTSPWTPEPYYPPRPTPIRPPSEYVLIGDARQTRHGIEIRGSLYPKDERGWYFNPATGKSAPQTFGGESPTEDNEPPQTIIPQKKP